MHHPRTGFPMFRLVLLAAVSCAWPAAGRAQDAIAPETVEAVKKATVFIRVEADGRSASGSGFVVAADGPSVLVATNDHVVASKPPSAGKAAITVVFDSGTRAERAYPAQV